MAYTTDSYHNTEGNFIWRLTATSDEPVVINGDLSTADDKTTDDAEHPIQHYTIQVYNTVQYQAILFEM